MPGSLCHLPPPAVADPVCTPSETNGSLNSDNTDGPWSFWGDLVYSLTIHEFGSREYAFGTDAAAIYLIKGSGYIDAPIYAHWYIDIHNAADGAYVSTFDHSGPAGSVTIPLEVFSKAYKFTPASPAFISSGLRLKYKVETEGDVSTVTTGSALF